MKILGYSWLTVLIVALLAWFLYSRYVATRK